MSRYRSARQAGAVDIEDFLAQTAPDDRGALLIEIIEIERTLSPEAEAKTFLLAKWIERFPEYAATLKRHFRITTESSVNLSMQSTVDRPPGSPATPSPPTDFVALPRRLGRYELQTRLGAGTFGEVWRAHDPELRRDVALKVIRPNRHWTEQAIEDFLKEGRRLARVQSSSVVSIFDVGRDSGICFLVSQLIEGETLAARIRRGPLASDEAATLVAIVAEAAHAAHVKDIVHRDIKPANILIDQEGKPYLADFGLAVSYEEQLDEVPAVLGTLAYMSPEQTEGRSHLVDNRTDIYSLGAVLYELLTGRRPFEGRTFAEYIEQVQTRPARPLRTVNDQISPELERICLKALSTSVDERYTTALDLSKELRVAVSSFDHGKPAQNDIEKPVDRSGAFYRTRKVLVAFEAAVATAALLVAAIKFNPRADGEAAPLKPHSSESNADRETKAETIELFDRLPTELLPSKAGLWEVDTRAKTLYVTSPERSPVLSLGEVPAESWELSLTIRAEGVPPRAAPMETCIFFGAEKSIDFRTKKPRWRGDMIEIRPAIASDPAMIRYCSVNIDQRNDKNPNWSAEVYRSQEIELVPDEVHHLRIRCSRRGLESIQWDRRDVLSIPAGDQAHDRPRPLLGKIMGIMLLNGNVSLGAATVTCPLLMP